MNQDLLGIIVSFLFVLFVIGLASLGQKTLSLAPEVSRKIIHIGVSNWWLLAMYYFTSPVWATLGPLLFILVNFISLRFHLIQAMESEHDRKSTGTVLFPISLAILSMFCFGPLCQPYVGALGVLSMGYGDGVAALVGQRWGKKKIPFLKTGKSYIGSLGMFFASWFVCAVVLLQYDPDIWFLKSVLLASFATILEALTPKGFDNLIVPLGTSFFYYFIFY